MTTLRSLPDAGRDLWLGTVCVGCGGAGRVLCRGCDTGLPRGGRLAWPSPCPPGLAPPYAAGDYDGLLRVLVNQHKEGGVLALAGPLGRVLGDVVGTALGAAGVGRSSLPVWLVPVPSRRSVVRGRGHDPLLRTARVAAARLRCTGTDARVRPLLLTVTRVRDQAGLGAAERSSNLSGSMRARPTGVLPRPRARVLVVVVDDVLTTGATAREAQRALADSGVDVSAVATVAATRSHRRVARRFAAFPTVRPPWRLSSAHGVRPGPWLHRRSTVRGRRGSADR